MIHCKCKENSDKVVATHISEFYQKARHNGCNIGINANSDTTNKKYQNITVIIFSWFVLYIWPTFILTLRSNSLFTMIHCKNVHENFQNSSFFLY